MSVSGGRGALLLPIALHDGNSGFEIEVYWRGMGFVDALYRERPGGLMSLLGNSKLDLSLQEWIAGQSCNANKLDGRAIRHLWIRTAQSEL